MIRDDPTSHCQILHSQTSDLLQYYSHCQTNFLLYKSKTPYNMTRTCIPIISPQVSHGKYFPLTNTLLVLLELILLYLMHIALQELILLYLMHIVLQEPKSLLAMHINICGFMSLGFLPLYMTFGHRIVIALGQYMMTIGHIYGSDHLTLENYFI